MNASICCPADAGMFRRRLMRFLVMREIGIDKLLTCVIINLLGVCIGVSCKHGLVLSLFCLERKGRDGSLCRLEAGRGFC